MTDFTFDDLLNLIQMAQTLNDTERREWRIRLFKEFNENDGHLSEDSRQGLAHLFQREIQRIDGEIPQTEQQYDEVRENEQDEVEAIRPDLQTLVQDYQVQTDEIVKDYQKGFHLIDKEVDGVLQTVFAETDQADIEAIKAQLSRPRLNS
ncbi:MAG: hypothetical protein ACD_28C00244G0015 [uncultured bacterium]|nr:MAG: hypothetical protein ACD_28C00244G0015 [uncultured bacterium]